MLINRKGRDISCISDGVSAAMVFSGFSVHPRRSRIPLLREWVGRYGLVNATSIGLVGWSDDREAFYFHGERMGVNPFSSTIMGESCCAGGDRDDGDVIQDHMFGRSCSMDDGEWCLFCREVLLLEEPIAQTMDAVVAMVDEMLVFIVHAVAGKGDFVTSDGSRLMELVVMLVRFLMLCGGTGILPYDYSMFRFGGVDPFGGPVVPGGGGRSVALKVMRRLVSLGRCVRNLIRVAWDRAEWVEPDLVESLGLGGKGDVFLCDIWRAVAGTDTPLAVFMQNVVGPSYLVDGASDLDKGHIVLEYDSTVWKRGQQYTPMSSETLVGGVVSSLVYQSGRYASFGGLDRQYQVFLHNLHWGFMHRRKYIVQRGSAPFPTDMLALFGIVVGRCVGGNRPLEFRLGKRSSWQLEGASSQSLKENKKAMTRFLSPIAPDGVYMFGAGGSSVGRITSIGLDGIPNVSSF